VKYVGGSLGIEILGTFRETVELLVQEHASQHQRKGSVRCYIQKTSDARCVCSGIPLSGASAAGQEGGMLSFFQLTPHTSTCT